MKRILIFLVFISSYVFGQSPNYSEDIAPIIYNKCLQCHHTGGIGPLSLETYPNAVSNAGLIQHVVSTGEMPPWPPDTTYQRFAYENILSIDEIAKITDWITAGVPLGDTNLLPQMPIFSNNSNFGPADLEIQIPTYSSTATSNSDDYVCISIPSGLVQDRQVRAIEVIPGNIEIVHHVLVAINEFGSPSTTITPNCMAPIGGDQVYTYAPGSLPIEFPIDSLNKFGIEIPANSSIELGMHYPEGTFGQLDSTKVKFYFYPQNTAIREIYTEYLITEGLPPDPPFSIPANQITQMSSSYGPIINDISVMSIFPHMHLLGKDMECFAVTPTNDTINLIRINKWDFEWQGAYLYKQFIKIPAGSIIYAFGTYDNTASITNPNPVLVQSGLNTDDEMFVFIFQFLDYQIGDENIVLENTSLPTSIFDNSIGLNRKLIYETNLLGQQIKSIKNMPKLMIYDDGSVEKRVVID
ncbi:MAG: c-type cytochrome [Flavobacteriales bacterium]